MDINYCKHTEESEWTVTFWLWWLWISPGGYPSLNYGYLWLIQLWISIIQLWISIIELWISIIELWLSLIQLQIFIWYKCVFMDIHNSFRDIHNSSMDIHKWIMDIHNWITDIYCIINYEYLSFNSVYVPSQWKMALKCNAISHWLGTITEESLIRQNYIVIISWRPSDAYVICVGNLSIIGSDNGLLPGRRQAIIWTNAGILLIGPWGTNSNDILMKIIIFSFKKMHLKVSSAKCRPFCLGLNVLY